MGQSTKISIDECRRLLKNPQLTDEEIEMYRDEMYELVNRFLDEFFSKKENSYNAQCRPTP